MSSRWFGAAVVLLWLAMMTWLVKEKVLPLMLVGDPPSTSRVIAAQREKPAVGWEVIFAGRPVGWALGETRPLRTGLTEIRGRVHFSVLPLDEVMPSWLRPLAQAFDPSKNQTRLDAGSLLTIDGLGHQVRFDLTLRFEPWNETVSVRGSVEGGQAQLQVKMRGSSFEQTVPLSSSALLSDAFSPQPQTELPGLRPGQTWTVPIYMPLWPDKNRLEILRATVLNGMQTILWNGKAVRAFVIEYRSESANGPGGAKPRARLWVRRNGTVLKQEATVFGTTTSFVRLPDHEAERLVAEAGQQWWNLEDVRQQHD